MKSMGIDFSFDLDTLLNSGALIHRDHQTVWLGCGLSFSRYPDSKKTSLFAPNFFFSDPNPWLVFDQIEVVDKTALLEIIAPLKHAPIQVATQVQASKKLFKRYFDRIIKGFDENRWLKVVPYAVSTFNTPVNIEQLIHAMNRVLRAPPPLMPYGFWTDRQGMIGATPEMLFCKTPSKVTSIALAGTRSKGSSALPLLKDPKELLEHELVADDIENVFSKLGKVETGPTNVVELPYLEHLKTVIEVSPINETSYTKLAALLHPTPALGAKPRNSADSLFKDLNEEQPRERYGAPFGYRTPDGNGRCLVAIRNLQWNLNTVRLAAGCGIVPASRFENEWSEFLAKQQSVMKLLGL